MPSCSGHIINEVAPGANASNDKCISMGNSPRSLSTLNVSAKLPAHNFLYFYSSHDDTLVLKPNCFARFFLEGNEGFIGKEHVPRTVSTVQLFNCFRK